ncbi:kelch-like protein 2 [Episyrphus balteatus]|uniref:kelch-like protein 2 n=1 Tax=Episyrphus balteatus TaxID=286459 RepID=UPI0024864455|nr:kelch-like protein 2 [Episyrphus balteatus]
MRQLVDNCCEREDKSHEDQLFELLSLVNYRALSPKFIVENRESVCKTVETYKLTDKWLEWLLADIYEREDLFGSGNKCVQIEAHRVVLCAFSEYFLELFREKQKLSKDNVVELKEIEALPLKNVIDFMYKGSIDFTVENVEGILRTASFLKMRQLVNGCCEMIRKCINSDNFLMFIRLANELDLDQLKNECLEGMFIHFERISKRKIQNISFKDLDIYDLYRAKCAEKEDVFLSMVAWINSDKSHEDQLFELLSLVNYRALSPKFNVENRELVCKTVQTYTLTDRWLEWLLDDIYDREDIFYCKFIKRKNDTAYKLAVIGVRFFDTVLIIKTYDRYENSWNTKIKIRSPSSDIIVIDGKLIAVGCSNGGNDDDRKGVQSLDLDTLEWIDLPPMNKSRIRPKLAHLNGHLCVFGTESGQNTGFDQKSASIGIYNFSTQKWHDLEPISQPSDNSEIASFNGMLYIIDFENGFLQSYDISSNKWTLKAIAKDPRLWNFGFAATKEFLYVYGGCYLMFCNIEYINKVKRFDLRNKYNCCEMKPFPFRRCLIESFVIKKHIIICDTEKVDIYDIEKDEWENLGGVSAKNEWSSCALAYLNL